MYQLELAISKAKASYAEGLANLEDISEQIHLQRRLKDELQQRDSGCATVSESVSFAGSFDLASVNEGIEERSHTPLSTSEDKHQRMLDTLHDLIFSKCVICHAARTRAWAYIDKYVFGEALIYVV